MDEYLAALFGVFYGATDGLGSNFYWVRNNQVCLFTCMPVHVWGLCRCHV